MHDHESQAAILQTVAQEVKSTALGWSMVIIFVAFNICGALLLRNEIQKIESWHFPSVRSIFFCFIKLASSWKIILAIASLFSSTIAWSVALAHLELSRAYPVGIALHFLAIMTSSMLIYGESITFFKLFGVFLILSGVVSILK